jgi:hypothetical protein
MNCILNHCHAQISNDSLVIGAYGAAVLTMLILASFARSKSIRTAAFLIAGSWVMSSFAFFYFDARFAIILTAILIDLPLAWKFRQMTNSRVFPSALCLLMLGEVLFVLAAAAVALDTYWLVFGLNRIFEITILYVIGCSLLRLRLLRAEEQDTERSNRRPSHSFEAAAPVA